MKNLITVDHFYNHGHRAWQAKEIINMGSNFVYFIDAKTEDTLFITGGYIIVHFKDR